MNDAYRFEHPRFELHVARQARDRYGLDDSLFSISGSALLTDLPTVRRLVQTLNAQRNLADDAEPTAYAGQLYSLGLLHEFMHRLLARYRQERAETANIMGRALAFLRRRFSGEAVDRALLRFVQLFPPTAVYRGQIDAATYLATRSADVPNTEIVLEEMIMLWLAFRNPAFAPFRELFDDQQLELDTGYREMIASLTDFFADAPGFRGGGNLFLLLQAPIDASPHSVDGQLRYLLAHFGELVRELLGEDGLLGGIDRLLIGLDLIKEEQRPFTQGGGGPPGPPPPRVMRFDHLLQHGPDGLVEASDEARFTDDRSWMPELLMLAKNTYVWLDQLSKRYQRPIERLDQIPDEELDRLASWGVTGLWLIGLWERSRASQRIKQLCGNPDAAASAYSLKSYRLAERLGGEAAREDLQHRAWRRGIRLACDMVPNHTGIDSDWMAEHPEWFLGSDESPYPNYRFTGEDLSQDARFSVRIEDHYYDRTDAAVVFQRRDNATGHTRYIYHGNDGTSMPWNDTAQIDYLNGTAREAVIQTILDVARRFRVIRFDAAMTLAKQHVQRLWYPPPGAGGDIPSRAERGLTRAEFERLMPEEFWREVVDRIQAEVPDTLLLAEAFWLMESYFVRTLGMHRVYNSAFMHMMRDEHNQKYRASIKNTLAFDPEILKRFVNFLTNPDEETAVHQFGRGDKYFGICTVMVTLPGLPMFGHGQFEGLAEKYGMEYQRAYHNEDEDGHMVERHEREIVPLMHRRHLFAESANFQLYDVIDGHGHVHEDVFAYSNRVDTADGPQIGVVLYHNRYHHVRGRIHAATPKRDTQADRMTHSTFAEALRLRGGDDLFYAYRDLRSGLEFLRPSVELHTRGLEVDLGAYECRVLLDFRTLEDGPGREVRRLYESLRGHGVPSIDEALYGLRVQPVQAPVRDVVQADLLRRLLRAAIIEHRPSLAEDVGTHGGRVETLDMALDDLERRLARVASEVRPHLPPADEAPAPPDDATLASDIRALVETILRRLLVTPPPPPADLADAAATDEALRVVRALLRGAGDEDDAATTLVDLDPDADDGADATDADGAEQAGSAPAHRYIADEAPWLALIGWALVHRLGDLQDPRPASGARHAVASTWLLLPLIGDALRELGVEHDTARRLESAVSLATAADDLAHAAPDDDAPDNDAPDDAADAIEDDDAPGDDVEHRGVAERLARRWFARDDARGALEVNEYDGITWFNREAFTTAQWIVLATRAATALARADEPSASDDARDPVPALRAASGVHQLLALAEEVSGYRVDQLLRYLEATPRMVEPETDEVDDADDAPEPDDAAVPTGASAAADPNGDPAGDKAADDDAADDATADDTAPAT